MWCALVREVERAKKGLQTDEGAEEEEAKQALSDGER